MSTSPNDFPKDGPGPGPPIHELPPVEPPTAGFILQLFVIPAVIVAVLIVVVALFGKLAEGRRDPAEYLQSIRSGNNFNVQWRAAHELASLIQNEPELARDPNLLAKLTQLLDEELAKAKPGDDPRVREFLAAALGVFQTLDVRSSVGRSVDPIATLAAALAPAQPPEVRKAATESLARQAARLEGRLDDPRAVQALARAARDESMPKDASDDTPKPYEIRRRAVFALGFLGGDEARNVLRERMLRDGDRLVRYNAASALARRGDLDTLDALREMLSTADLTSLVKASTDAETRNLVESIQVEALRALQTSVRDGHPLLAERLRPEIGGLARSPSAEVRINAEAVLKNLPAAPNPKAP